MRCSCLVAIAASCCGAIAAQTTWTVDAAGGANFTDIPPAIAAASPGDHIEVRGTATYSAFVVDRGIDIFAISRAVTPTIEVVGVPAGQHARVTGFHVQRQGGVRPISVRTCQASVLLVDLLEVGVSYHAPVAYHGLELVDSPRVFVHGGSFAGQSATGAGAYGLSLVRSNAAVFGATIRGGTAVSNSSTSGGSGMSGIRITTGCHLLLDGVTVYGGSATSASMVGGSGGDALQVDLGAFAVAVGQSAFLGAVGGSGMVHTGSHGDAITGDAHYTLDCTLSGAVVTATSIPNRPTLRTAATVPLGTRLDVAVHGEAGQLVLLMLDLVHDYAPMSTFDGAWVLTTNAFYVGAVGLDATGAGNGGIVVPMNPRLRHLDVFCQGGTVVAGAPVLLAPAHTRTQ